MIHRVRRDGPFNQWWLIGVSMGAPMPRQTLFSNDHLLNHMGRALAVGVTILLAASITLPTAAIADGSQSRDPPTQVEIVFVESGWDPIIPNLNDGEMCDAILSAMTKTVTREEVVDFTRTYFTTSQGVIGATGSPTISDVSELNAAGTTIALQSGTTSDFYAQGWHTQTRAQWAGVARGDAAAPSNGHLGRPQ